MEKTFPKKVDNRMTIAEICSQVGCGELISGDPSTIIEAIASPEEAERGSLMFCKYKGKQLQRILEKSNASVAVVEESLPPPPHMSLVFTSDSVSWIINALHIIMDLEEKGGISDAARVDDSAEIGDDVTIGAGTVIEESCFIDDGTRIGTNCYIGPGTRFGKNCYVQSNASIGGVGLGYHFAEDGSRLFYPHLGRVLIERDVVIGSGTVIVRGQLSDTRVGQGARLGNLVNIGHNVSIGAETAISSSVSIAGGAVIGERCNIAVGVAVNARIHVGSGSMVGLGSVVTKSIPEGKAFFGNPARPLPTMRKF